MKNFNILKVGILATALTGLVVTACEESDELYEVGEPSWLASKVDSLKAISEAAAKADTVVLAIDATTVGSKDCTAGWWTAFSDYFEVPAGKKLVVEFTNYSSGANNWNNWNLAAANTKRDANGYSEYFVIRSDAYGWGGGYDGTLMSTNYFDEGNAADWAEWLAAMNGAEVVLEVDHSAAGPTFVTATQAGNDGKTYVETFTCETTTSASIFAWIVADGSYFEFHRAYLVASEITTIEDQAAKSIAITDSPKTVDLGDDNFWGSAVATVTFADGTSAKVDSADLTLSVSPDMSTIGQKTVTVAYSKTKQGNYGQAVAAVYTIEVVSEVTEISAVASSDTYFYAPGTTEIKEADIDVATLIKSVIGKTAEGAEVDIPAEQYTTTVSIPETFGEDITISITYKELTTELTIKVAQMESEKVSMAAEWGTIGAEDNTTAFWGAHAPEDYHLEQGKGAIFTFTNYTSGANNYNNFIVVLRSADKATEYIVGRADNWSWGTGWSDDPVANLPVPDGLTKSNDMDGLDWANWLVAMNETKVEAEIINKGSRADIMFTMTSADGTHTFKQNYLGVPITGDDLYIDFTVDGSHLVFE